jgi:ubiquinone/menaquinone biosynthesis C-methylase UbiE
VVDFPSTEKLQDIMEKCGLKNIQVFLLTGGIVAVHVGMK